MSAQGSQQRGTLISASAVPHCVETASQLSVGAGGGGGGGGGRERKTELHIKRASQKKTLVNLKSVDEVMLNVLRCQLTY